MSSIIVFKKYKLAVPDYLAGGNDGFDMFKDCHMIVSWRARARNT